MGDAAGMGEVGYDREEGSTRGSLTIILRVSRSVEVFSGGGNGFDSEVIV